MRSTFLIIAALLTLTLGWYSNVAVELGLRSAGESVPDAGLIIVAVVLVLVMRRRPSTKSVTH